MHGQMHGQMHAATDSAALLLPTPDGLPAQLLACEKKGGRLVASASFGGGVVHIYDTLHAASSAAGSSLGSSSSSSNVVSVSVLPPHAPFVNTARLGISGMEWSPRGQHIVVCTK